jgi:hypothetical protein
MQEPNSEIAYFREQQALEEQAVYLGLRGLAWDPVRYDVILKRMRQGVERFLQLLEEDKYQDVQKLMMTDSWGREVRRITRHSRRANTKGRCNGQTHSGH